MASDLGNLRHCVSFVTGVSCVSGCQSGVGSVILFLLPGCALCRLKVVVGASLAAFEFFLIVGGDAPVVRLCRAMAL